MRLVVYLVALAEAVSAMPAAVSAMPIAVKNPELVVTLNGRGTVYLQNGYPGSCGQLNNDNDVITAIGMQSQSPGPDCGRLIQATNTGSNDGSVGGQGNSITVPVQDTCGNCGENDVGFSVGAWNLLTNGAPFDTFNLQWNFLAD